MSSTEDNNTEARTPGAIMAEMIRRQLEGEDVSEVKSELTMATNKYFADRGIKVSSVVRSHDLSAKNKETENA